MPEWTPTTDGLPPVDLPVLISIPAAPTDKVWLGYYSKNSRWFYDNGVAVSYTVTAWMYRPECYMEPRR